MMPDSHTLRARRAMRERLGPLRRRGQLVPLLTVQPVGHPGRQNAHLQALGALLARVDALTAWCQRVARRADAVVAALTRE